MMAWWDMAKVGDKVVCIRDDAFHTKTGGDHRTLKKGAVFTIRQIWPIPSPPYSCPVALYFEELKNSFTATGFRPVQPTEAGMEILRGLLKPAKQPVKKDA